MNNKVYIFLADGFEDVEALAVVDLLRRADIEIETVSIKDTKEVRTSHGIQLLTDRIFSETDFSDGDMLVLPGGMPGTRYLGEFKPLTDLLISYNKDGKKLAAICAAPTVLGKLGILSDRKATCFPAMMPELICREKSEDRVVVDGNITTSRGMGTAIEFGLSIIAQLISEEKSEEIAKTIVFH